MFVAQTSDPTGGSDTGEREGGLLALTLYIQQKQTSTMARVRVCTYNILSSALANPSELTACDPANLLAAARLPRIQTKVRAVCAKGFLSRKSLPKGGASPHMGSSSRR